MSEKAGAQGGITDEDRELLTAYLDHELAPAERLQLEERLARDALLRQELAELSEAWDALEELAPSTVGEPFTQTTMELVLQDVQLADPQRRSGFWTGLGRGALVLFGAFLAGTLLAWLRPDPSAGVARMWPLLRSMKVLEAIPDVEFLRQLVAAESPGVSGERAEAGDAVQQGAQE